jgi:predicted nucleotide-binding protein
MFFSDSYRKGAKNNMKDHQSKVQHQHSGKNKRVYVISGTNTALQEEMYTFLRALGLQPIEQSMAVNWTGETSPFIGTVINTAFTYAQAIIILLTGEDTARLREQFWNQYDTLNETEFHLQPGMDQIFEAGYAFGQAPKRTILIQISNIKLFSDIDGRHISNFTGTPSERHLLKNQLKTAGCEVDDTGSSWLTAGNFRSIIS